MNLKLKCTHDCILSSPMGFFTKDIEIKNGDILDTTINETEGVRFKLEEGYSFPFSIYYIEKNFTAIPNIIQATDMKIYTSCDCKKKCVDEIVGKEFKPMTNYVDASICNNADVNDVNTFVDFEDWEDIYSHNEIREAQKKFIKKANEYFKENSINYTAKLGVKSVFIVSNKKKEKKQMLGYMYEPDGVGNYKTGYCQNCNNSHCSSCGTNRHVYCNDMILKY